jgi:uncharacterized protein (TIGR03437 family)
MLLRPGSEPQPLAAIEEGAQFATLSGSGEIAWALTTTGRVLRIRTIDGTAEAVLPQTPIGGLTNSTAVPGSAVRIIGTGLSTSMEVMLDGSRFPVTEASPGRAAFQVPWEFDGNGNGTSTTPLLLLGAGNPFEHVLRLFVSRRPVISFERDVLAPVSPAPLQMAHQDFRGVVTAEDPALPGETVHLFATNMGPVDRPVATGDPGPSPDPARVTLAFACYVHEVAAGGEFVPGGRVVGVEVPFAGLAGGVVGVYQIDITIPRDWPPGPARVSCRADPASDSGLFHVGLAQ